MTTSKTLSQPYCQNIRGCWGVLVVAVALQALNASPAEAQSNGGPAMRWKIHITESGVYKVGRKDLPTAGAGYDSNWPSESLRLESRGASVPIWIEDGSDGSFDSSDWIEFVGTFDSRDHELDFAPSSIYWLTAGNEESSVPALRLRDTEAPAEVEASESDRAPSATLELEENRIFLPQGEDQGPSAPSWAWTRLTQEDPKPFEVSLDEAFAGRLDRDSPRGLEVSLNLIGRSRPKIPLHKDHRVEVLLNGSLLAGVEWNGDTRFKETLGPISLSQLKPAGNRLAFRVPKRRRPDGRVLIDVLYLDQVSLTFPRSERLDRPETSGSVQERLRMRLGSTIGVRAKSDTEDDLLVFSPDRRVQWSGDPQPAELQLQNSSSANVSKPDEVWVTRRSGLKTPAAIQRASPSDLRSRQHQVDYVMIVESSLKEAIEPLALHHREKGLAVEVVDVQSVYDEFNHGIVHPEALRRYLRYTTEARPAPVLRFALLVGDAAWNGRFEQRIADQPSARTTRDLIPTWRQRGPYGAGATDQHYVDFRRAVSSGQNPAESDHLAKNLQIALGRIPAATPEWEK